MRWSVRNDANKFVFVPLGSLFAGQCAGIPQARHAGTLVEERRRDAGDQRHEQDVQAEGQ